MWELYARLSRSSLVDSFLSGLPGVCRFLLQVLWLAWHMIWQQICELETEAQVYGMYGHMRCSSWELTGHSLIYAGISCCIQFGQQGFIRDGLCIMLFVGIWVSWWMHWCLDIMVYARICYLRAIEHWFCPVLELQGLKHCCLWLWSFVAWFRLCLLHTGCSRLFDMMSWCLWMMPHGCLCSRNAFESSFVLDLWFHCHFIPQLAFHLRQSLIVLITWVIVVLPIWDWCLEWMLWVSVAGWQLFKLRLDFHLAFLEQIDIFLAFPLRLRHFPLRPWMLLGLCCSDLWFLLDPDVWVMQTCLSSDCSIVFSSWIFCGFILFYFWSVGQCLG